MLDNGHHTSIVFENQAAKDAIYRLTTKGQDNTFCCCGGDSISCNISGPFLPDQLNGIISQSEFTVMVKEIDQVFQETHVPLFCALECGSQRVKRIQQVLEKYTLSISERGYYWESAPGLSPMMGMIGGVEFAYLKINQTAADRYHQSNPNGTFVTAAAVLAVDDSTIQMGVMKRDS